MLYITIEMKNITEFMMLTVYVESHRREIYTLNNAIAFFHAQSFCGSASTLQ